MNFDPRPALEPGDDGLILGAGNDGRVFKVDRQGRGTQFFDATELEAHALAPAPNGGVYVGTSPRGKIYRVDRTGNATTFFDPGTALGRSLVDRFDEVDFHRDTGVSSPRGSPRTRSAVAWRP